MKNPFSKEVIDVDAQLEEHAQHYSDKKFSHKIVNVGKGLGVKALTAATTLFAALKSDEMSKANKMIIIGALGYFIFPLDLVADVLPVIGLSDDAFILVTALAKVYTSITDEMKEEGERLANKIIRKGETTKNSD
jgi:uncharacterized membrane protein YkvA (DUF1232 family)